ncbi:hypothetical protein ASPWEDRAFT_41473 [Aspergillus terreus]|uniref:Uncharacterized protein n=1 Tax=Aspergillus terreus TaxID=33178 RepID=A0A5M3ZFI2_ASPTE|nr:hypothetical protein ATETN484_0018012400 [Aspergillus terreus]GFF21898.1 hypothetical protein ASPWEDRAFT_41473 [Aspergillus terreus]
MVKISALVTLALASVALATTNAECQKKYDTCRTGANANMATCVANHESCCADAYSTCQSSGDPNEAECAALNAACKGQK